MYEIDENPRLAKAQEPFGKWEEEEVITGHVASEPFFRKTSTLRLRNNPLLNYAICLAKAPGCFACMYFLGYLVVIPMMWRGIEVEKDFSALIRADGESLRHADALELAQLEQKGATGRRLSNLSLSEVEYSAGFTGRRLSDASLAEAEHSAGLASHSQPGKSVSNSDLDSEAWPEFVYYYREDVKFIYEAVGGNALDEQVLLEVRDFERGLRQIPQWHDMCVNRAFESRWSWTCDPGESLSPFAFPSSVKPNKSNVGENILFELRFDAEGKDLLPFTVMSRYMHDSMNAGDTSRDPKRFFPDGWDLNSYLNGTGAPPHIIKSSFAFHLGYGDWGMTQSQFRNQRKAVKSEMLAFWKQVHEQIEKWFDRLTEKRVMNIYYASVALEELDTENALNHDLILSAGSIIFVSLWMCIMMKSAVMSIGCFFVVFGSLPLAFVLTPAERTTLAYFSAVFLITIIDIDVIFIFVNFWHQSKGSHDSIEDRICWTMGNAGKSCMATSLTTSVSFFANLASSLQPLREFGLFMGLCVMGVYSLAVLFLPPLMILEYRFYEWKRRCCYSSRKICDEGNLEFAEAGLFMVAAGSECDRSPLRAVPMPRCAPPEMQSIEPMPSIEPAPEPAPNSCEQHNSGAASSYEPAPSMSEKRSDGAGKLKLPDAPERVITPERVNRNVTPDRVSRNTTPSDRGDSSPTSTKESLTFHDKTGLRQPKVAFFSMRIKRSLTFKFLFYLVDWVSRWACLVLSVTLATVPMFLIGFINNYELDLGNPKLFPAEHNTNMAKALLKDFDKEVSDLNPNFVTEDWKPQVVGSICDATNFWSRSVHSNCLFHWCDIDSAASWNNHTAICHRTQTMGTSWSGAVTTLGYGLRSCREVKLRNRFASGGVLPPRQLSLENAWRQILRGAAADIEKDLSTAGDFSPNTNLPTLALESWETGSVATEDFFESTLYTHINSSAEYSCTFDTMCFAYMPSCTMGPKWTSTGKFDMPTAFSGTQRLLFDECGPCTDVNVVWGITVPLSSPMVGAIDWKWRYDPTFDLSNPWAQRAIYTTCTSALATDNPQNLDENICEATCWIEDFKMYVNTVLQERFPTRNLEQDILAWFDQAEEKYRQQLWFEGLKVVATKVSFCTLLPKSSAAILSDKKRWDEWLSSLNNQASLTASRAWHFSHVWVSAEANEAIVSSTLLTIILEIAIGWICILVFTGDPILAVIVLSLVVINICGLAFFMVVIFRWKIGPIEVICLLVFVGYSVTFGLHVSGDYARVREDDPDLLLHLRMSKEMNRYCIFTFWKAFQTSKPERGKLHEESSKEDLEGEFESETSFSSMTEREKRVGRTRIAVLHVGGAIVSAALSSVGTSMFLLMCTLTIFTKIGAVVLTITVLSVVVTLISLPAALIVCGPGFHPCYKRCIIWICKRCISA